MAGGKYSLPSLPSAPVRRDGLLSIKPNNLRCDDEGRNCKFVDRAAGNAPPSPRGELPDGKLLRNDLELLKGAL